MKNYLYPAFTFTLSIFLSASLPAQGIYQLWGTTAQGGSADVGVVFRTDINGSNASAVHSFTKSNFGARPMYNQLAAYNGKFYAATSAGGSNDMGVIFEWDPATNTYTKKYDFELANGINPHGDLVLLNNKFYGMTLFGGANDQGVIFEWDPASNIYTKKIDFNGTNGSKPYGGLVFNAGKFYGMTNSGGTNSKGVIFQWDPATNAYQKLYDFDGANGANPFGNLVLQNGKLYGMTNKGGSNDRGVIFEWNLATNAYTNKIEFDHFTNGSHPYGSLVLSNNKFYGMTHSGGAGDRQGVIFEWDPATNIYTKKYDFDFTGNPYGNLVLNNGKFYGTVYSEYRSKGLTRGALFEWDPVTNTYTDKYKYEVTTIVDNTHMGELTKGTLVSQGGKLYGMSSEGGSSDDGVIFEWDPAGNVYSKKINFNGAQSGQSPNSLAYQQDHLYGVTREGGVDGMGVIFEWDFASNQYVKKHDFDGNAPASASNGNVRYPQGALTYGNGKFYGTSFYVLPAPSFHQHIFEWAPSTNTFVKKAPFSPGLQPTADLVENAGKYYGMWQGNGGGIFSWDPATNTYSSLHAFTNVAPAIAGSLAVKDGKLYGIGTGGNNNAGVIFEWDIAGNAYQDKYHLVAATGSTPTGSMTLYNGKFYGLTDAGGIHNKGVLFEWDPVSNVYTKKYDFNADANPAGHLVIMNGKLFGMTKTGGNFGFGAIFEWDPVTNTYTKKSDFTNANGRNPADKNVLTVVPVSVTPGSPGTCTNSPQININTSNKSEWVPVVDANGLAVAEIKANGNELGIVTASVYINNGAVRKDDGGRAYLDRNITITPQFQPTTPVDIRLYISSEEFASLKNSNAPGINTVNDLGIFKNGDGCGSEIGEKASPVAATAANWGNDYVLSASVSKFSTFYFASKSNVALPLTLLEFSGKLQNNTAVLNWKTEHEVNTSEFVIERSTDGNQYTAVGSVNASNSPGQQNYNFTDPSIYGLGSAIIYYRLRQNDMDGQFTYSKVVTLSLDATNGWLRLYPNPVHDELSLWIQSSQRENIKWQIVDLSGRVVNMQTRSLTPGLNKISIDVSKISKGIYFIKVQGKGDNKLMKFSKQ